MATAKKPGFLQKGRRPRHHHREATAHLRQAAFHGTHFAAGAYRHFRWIVSKLGWRPLSCPATAASRSCPSCSGLKDPDNSRRCPRSTSGAKPPVGARFDDVQLARKQQAQRIVQRQHAPRKMRVFGPRATGDRGRRRLPLEPPRPSGSRPPLAPSGRPHPFQSAACTSGRNPPSATRGSPGPARAAACSSPRPHYSPRRCSIARARPRKRPAQRPGPPDRAPFARSPDAAPARPNTPQALARCRALGLRR